MDLSHCLWWRQDFLILLLAYFPSCFSLNYVAIGPNVVGNRGENVTLQCSLHVDKPTSYWLTWLDEKSDTSLYIYRPTPPMVDAAVDDPNIAKEDQIRYTRQDQNLVILRLKEHDSGVKCCQVQLDSPLINMENCTELFFTDFQPDALQCFRHAGQPYTSGTALTMDKDDRLQLNCTYSNIFPVADFLLYKEGSEDAWIVSRNRTEATEQNNRFSLTVEIDIEVDSSATYVLAVSGQQLLRKFLIPVSYIGSSHTSSPRGRRAMVGSVCGMILLVVGIIVAALTFGYFKGKRSAREWEFIDDQEKAPQAHELVEKSQPSGSRSLLDEGTVGYGEPTFEV